jgi:hypothetical protein
MQFFQARISEGATMTELDFQFLLRVCYYGWREGVECFEAWKTQREPWQW